MFTSEVNVVTIDLPGHGNDTSNSKLTWDFSFITQAIDEVLAHFSDKKVYLLGYSMVGVSRFIMRYMENVDYQD